jgi:hypothetical protein
LGEAHNKQSRSEQRVHVLTRHPVHCMVVLSAG